MVCWCIGYEESSSTQNGIEPYFYASGLYQPFLTIVNAELFSSIRLNAATLRRPVAHHRPGDVGGSVIKHISVVKKYIDVSRGLVVEK
jgi:hypothetical protein